MDIFNKMCNIFSGDNVAGKVIVNGVAYESNGGSVNINSSGSRSQVLIDGKIVGSYSEVKLNVSIQGSCGNVETKSGDIKIGGDAKGYVKTVSGDVKCCDVDGSINTVSGDVEAYNVTGSVKTISGDIEHR